MQVYSLYFSVKNWQELANLAQKFFSQKNFFVCSMDSGHPKNEKKSKKIFSKIWPIFSQKCKSIAFTFPSKIGKNWQILAQKFFPKKFFLCVLWTRDIPKMKKNQKKFFQKFGRFLALFLITESKKFYFHLNQAKNIRI